MKVPGQAWEGVEEGVEDRARRRDGSCDRRGWHWRVRAVRGDAVGRLPAQLWERLQPRAFATRRARRRGVLSLRQVSLHKQRKVARAVTARKLLILRSEEHTSELP